MQHTDDHTRQRRALIMMVVLYVVFIAVTLIIACGCSPRIIERVQVQHDTLLWYSNIRDSVMVHDSVYLHEWQRGDTVYVEKTSWRVRWRDRQKTDTVYISKTDTLTQTKTIEKTTRRSLVERMRDAASLAGIFVVLLAGLYMILRRNS